MASTRAGEETTALLQRWNRGDPAAGERAVARVYGDLRRVAGQFFVDERNDHTLQPTALVHETYLRLQAQRRSRWANRTQFFAVAKRMMRRVLSDHAKGRGRLKRGGDHRRVDLDPLSRAAETPEDLYALTEALRALAVHDGRKARVVDLHFLCGLSTADTAQHLGCSIPTVVRDWRMAKAWLSSYLAARHRDGG